MDDDLVGPTEDGLAPPDDGARDHLGDEPPHDVVGRDPDRSAAVPLEPEPPFGEPFEERHEVAPLEQDALDPAGDPGVEDGAERIVEEHEVDASEALGDAPVQLDMAVPEGELTPSTSPSRGAADPTAGPDSVEASAPAPIELPLDDAELTSAADQQKVAATELLAVELDGAVLPERNGWFDEGVVLAGLTVVGAVAAVPSLRRRRPTTAPALVATLEELQIDARVEHADLQDLDHWLVTGRRVLISSDGSAGGGIEPVLEVRGVDHRGRRLSASDANGGHRDYDLDRFEVAWADSAFQVVMARGEGTVALLPVVLTDDDLLPVG